MTILRQKLRALRWWLTLKLIPNERAREILIRFRYEPLGYWELEQVHRLLNFIREEKESSFPRSGSDKSLDLASWDGAFKWFYGIQLTHWIDFRIEQKPDDELAMFRPTPLLKMLKKEPPGSFAGEYINDAVPYSKEFKK